ncbi:MAG: autotransporter domain-containing protein [Rickettsiaceae bacterium]|nr:autotransporter domain-containing protein [Rickettsiaceae bacterium]
MVKENKLSKWKLFLVSTSTVALFLSLNNSSAHAVSRVSQNATSQVSVNTDWNPAGPFNGSRDSILYGDKSHVIDLNASKTYAAINTNSQETTPAFTNLLVNSNVTIQSIVGTKGEVNAQFQGKNNFQLTGTDYSKLTSIDFNGQNGFLILFTDNIKLNTEFLSSKAGGGTIRINPNVTGTELTGEVSNLANPISIQVQNNADLLLNNKNTFKLSNLKVDNNAAVTTNTNIDLSSQFILASGASVTVGNNVNITANNIRSSAFGPPLGSIIFLGNSTLSARFESRNIENIEIGNGNLNLNITQAYTVANTKFTNANGSLTISKDQSIEFGNTILSSTTGNNAGSFILDSGNTTTVSATFSNTANALVQEMRVKTNSKGIINTTVHLGGNLTIENGAAVDVNSGKDINVTDITGSAANSGDLSLAGNNDINADIGNNFALKNVNVNGNVTFNGLNFKSENTAFSGNNNLIINNKGTVSINSKFGSDGKANNGTITVQNKSDVTFNGDFSNVANNKILNFTIGDDSTANLNIDLNLGNLLTLQNNAVLNIDKGKNINATDISGSAANFGEIVFKGNSTVTSSLGKTLSLNFIDIGAGKVTVNGDTIKIGEVRLSDAAGGSIFEINALNPTINIGTIKNTSGADKKGKIIVSKDATLSNNIGAANTTFEAIEVGAGELKLGANTIFSDEVRLTDPGGGSILNIPAGATLNVNSIKNTSGTDKKGIVSITGNVTLDKDIGAANTAFEAITIGAGELKFNNNAIFVDEIRLNDVNAIFNPATVTLNINSIKAGVDGQGKVKVDSNITLDKNIGENGKSLAAINVTNSKLTLSGNNVFAKEVKLFKGGGNAELEILNNTSLNAGALKTDTADQGTISTKGNIALGGDIGENGTKFKEIVVDAGELSLSNGTIYAGEIKLKDQNSILNLSGTILDDLDIKNTAGIDNVTRVKISGDTKTELNVGEVINPVEAIEIGNAKLDLDGGGIIVQKIEFSDINAILKFNNTSPLINSFRGEIRNTSGVANAGKIEVDTEVVHRGTFEDSKNRLNNIHFLSDKEFVTTSLKLPVNTITTATPNTGIITLNDNTADKELLAVIGTPGQELKTLAFGSQLTLKTGSAIYVDNLFLKATTNEGSGPVTAILIIEDGVTIGSKLTTNNIAGKNATGIINVQGNASFPKGVGEDVDDKRMQQVNFTPATNATISVSGDLFSDAITVTNPTLIIGDNVTVSGQNNVNINSSTIVFNASSKIKGTNNVVDSTLSLNGDNGGFEGNTSITNSTFNFGTKRLKFTNAANSTLTGSPNFNLTINPEKEIGQIIIDGGDLDTTGVTQNTLTLTLADLTTSLPTGTVEGIPGNADQYILFATSNGGSVQILNDSKVLFDLSVANNPFVTWTYSNGILTQIANQPADIDAVLQAIINANTPGAVPETTTQNVTIICPLLFQPDNQLGQDIITIAITEPESLPALIDSLQPSAAGGTAIAEDTQQAAQQAMNTITNQLTTLTAPAVATFASSDDIAESGVAAGDDHDHYDDKPDRHGIWGAPFLSNAKHKQKKFEPGYKLRASGVNFGYEFMVNEDLSIGASSGFIQNTIRHTDANEGDVTKSDIYLFSLNGAYELGNNWFTQGVFAYSHSKTVNRELRIIPRGREVATGKYDADNFSAELLAGYHFHPKEEWLSSTSFGVEYHYLGEIKYTETGTTAQNLSVKRKADNDVELILGQRISKEINYQNFGLKPDIHGHIRYDLMNKRGKLNVKLNNADLGLVSRTAEFERVHYNLGTGVTFKNDDIECGVDYDLYLAKKYVAHNGTLRLRINF